MAANDKKSTNNKRAVNYNKWGYIFLIPFFVAFILYNLIPLGMTVYYSFFEKYFDAGTGTWSSVQFVGFSNYIKLFYDGYEFDPRIFKYLLNTIIMWVLGFIPQIVVSLVLAQWFSDNRLKIRGSRFFKTVIYLPNLIMASAFAMLFSALFDKTGPISSLLFDKLHWISAALDFTKSVGLARFLVAFMNFLMWFGNTTILLMAGIMGIDESLYEAAEVDGANSIQRFTRITLPLLKPILIYVVITSLIGGIQMYDVPQILTNGSGDPVTKTTTLIMYLNQILVSKNYGVGGALSVILFLITGGLSLVVYNFMYSKKSKEKS